MSRASRLTTFAPALLLSCTLAACGGATVDSDDVTATPTATVSPTTATATVTSATSAATSSRTTATVTQTSTREAPAVEEIESIPEQASDFTPQEAAFLDHLRQNGLNVEGVEDQLTATGINVCADDVITRDAVAGQLVEQRRTDMDPAALGELIGDAARANLCS